MFRATGRLHLGAEFNPAADESGPLANLVVVTETERRPALIIGTSSDRIGTPSGRAWFATLSKDLEPIWGARFAPYLGLAYGTYEERTRPIGGLGIGLTPRWSALLIHDGVNFHPTLSWAAGRRWEVTALLVEGRDPGLSLSVSF